MRYWMVTLAQPDIRTLTIARQPGPRREYQRTWCLSSSPHLHETPCKVSISFQYSMSCHPIQMCACEPVSGGGTLSNWSKSPKTSILGPSAGTLGRADGQPLASRGPRWNSLTTASLTQHWLFSLRALDFELITTSVESEYPPISPPATIRVLKQIFDVKSWELIWKYLLQNLAEINYLKLSNWVEATSMVESALRDIIGRASMIYFESGYLSFFILSMC